MSKKFIIGDPQEKADKYLTLVSIGGNPEKIRELRELIIDYMENKCEIYDIWVDLPYDTPRFREVSQTPIRVIGKDYIVMRDVFPIDHWLTAYADIKWRGHVFAPPNLCKDAETAARQVFKDTFDIEFNSNATKFAKLPESLEI